MPTVNMISKDKVDNHHKDVPFHVLNYKYNYGATSQKVILKGCF